MVVAGFLSAWLVVTANAWMQAPTVAADAPALFAGLTTRALPLVAASALGGAASLLLLWTRRYRAARVAAALAVGAVLWGWAVAQYPWLLQGALTIEQAAADPAVLQALLTSLAVGAVLLVPSLVWLYVLFQRPNASTPGDPVVSQRVDAS